ncbi:fumarylacetoacetate hydrolase family protein [Dyadobacter tibetensis]|uniref:fumarylacetoacetate hydrolase family protein n=1 Tax=Dyadobacter tibetensis TaxID=1211851 RepID=UPI00046ED1C9|nr:fumarylacetoacetate hydrolase family protein [Dyadobacter tibetensis]
MKIICVGRNYTEHIAELNNERPDAPVIFLKPETAQIRAGEPFFYPEFSKDIHYEVELVVKINRVGKNIEERFAHKYYSEVAVGIDFTARDLQSELKAKGLPWELAKAFNGSAPVSEFVSLSELGDIQNLNFGLALNGEMKQEGNSSMMLYRVNHLISFISKFFMIKKGDLIFTGTPKGVGAVQIGDTLTTYLEGKEMMKLSVK